MASQAEFDYCLAQWEEQKEDEMEEEMEKEMLWEMLWEEFPQFQDDQLQDLLEKLLSQDRDYLDEKRSIMQDAAPLAAAWESAEILKKIFKWGKIPRHFQAVIFFLEN